MGRIFFFGSPFHGHLNPTLPIAAELRERGHEVVMLNHAGLRREIERAGLSFRDYAAFFEPPEEYRDPESFRPPTVLEHVAAAFKAAVAAFEPLREHLGHERPDCCVVDELALGAQFACEALGARFVSSLITLPVAPHFTSAMTAFAPSRQRGRGLPELFRDMRAFRKEKGIARRRLDPLNHSPFGSLVYTSRLFHSEQEHFDASYRYIGASLGGGGEDLRASRQGPESVPLIFVSFGTLYFPAPDLFRAIFEALGGGDWKVCVATGAELSAEHLRRLPPNVEARPRFPQLRMLSRARAFVTHGGLGSVTESLYFDCPMLVLPQAVDQDRNARRVVELGAGIALSRGEIDAAALRDGVARILGEESYGERATIVGRSIREAGGFRRGADAVEEVLRAG